MLSLRRRAKKYVRRVENYVTRGTRYGATKKPENETKALLLIHQSLEDILEELRVANDMRRPGVSSTLPRFHFA
jgi:hypothetical protein